MTCSNFLNYDLVLFRKETSQLVSIEIKKKKREKERENRKIKNYKIREVNKIFVFKFHARCPSFISVNYDHQEQKSFFRL